MIPRQGEIGGGAVYSSVIPIGDANTPFLSAELDAPVPYDITGPVGEAKPVDFEATPLVGGVAVPLSVEGTYTLAEDDADVDTSIGTIQGCRHVVGEATVSGEGLLDFIDDEQLSSTAEAWYHDDIGFVAAVIHRAPYDDIYFDMAGTVDYGEPGEGQHMIQGMGAVDASMSPFVLDTYDVKGQLDADKEVHAKMILELRYVDEDLARTDTPPGVNVEFGTAAGYFGHSLTASPYSFFHPEENDQDFRFWIAYVDQAAKNEPVNGIAYHVSVFPGTDVNPVRATARIIYTIYAP
ncbi:MAG: hypothetical protein M5R36_14700 [Deltaproteobacteria bacterium]|nr:hypothetical protein [Deltaproteobacteria bacterium]